jgi:hypothetical protein
MASRLDPTPSDSPKSLPEVLAGASTGKATVPGFAKKEVAKRKAKEPPKDQFTQDSDQPVTRQQYEAMMTDRPVKFGPKTSGFVRGGGSNGFPCSHCVHFYNSPVTAIAMEKPTHATCEVVRESSEKDEIEPNDTCKLFSKDGRTLPLLESEEGSEA